MRPLTRCEAFHSLIWVCADELIQIYILSTLNHHVALIRLHVHPRFLAVLDRSRTAEVFAEAATTPEDASWYGLRMARSRWYDFFKAEDRIEMMRALWGVMGWLMRDTTSAPQMEPAEDKDKTGKETQAEGAMDTREG
jgi:hypothetical protein